MDLSKMSVEELREEVRENQDNGRATDAFDELVRRLEEAQKELAEANGWLKHYRKAEPEQYAELRKRLERYDRRSESGESLCDWLDMADELKRLKLVVDGCICQGNWRLIIKESEPLFGKKFSSGDEDYKFIGVLHAEDDYYYVMMESNGLRYRFLSCVGAIADHGFNLKDQK